MGEWGGGGGTVVPAGSLTTNVSGRESPLPVQRELCSSLYVLSYKRSHWVTSELDLSTATSELDRSSDGFSCTICFPSRKTNHLALLSVLLPPVGPVPYHHVAVPPGQVCGHK